MAWTPPPNWPPPPSLGWAPPPGWQPDPAWGPPPPGWNFFPADAALPALPRVRTGALVAIAGAVLAIVGAVGTWVHISGPLGVTVNGSGVSNGRDGSIVIVLALVATGFAVLRLVRPGLRWSAWVIIALSALVLLVCLADIGDVHDKVDQAEALAPSLHGGVGWGLWLCTVAGLVMLAGAAASVDLRRNQPAISPTPGAG